MNTFLTSCVLSSVLVLTQGAQGGAQGVPDFSGTWTIVGAQRLEIQAGDSPQFFHAPLGGRFEVRQDANGLTMTPVSDSGARVVVWFDGSEATSRTPSIGRERAYIESTTAGRWEGSRLVFSGRTEESGRRIDRAVLWIDRSGLLVFEWTAQVPGLSENPRLTFKYRKVS